MGSGKVGKILDVRFPRNQLLLIHGQDRRSKVEDNQLGNFPYNLIGYIKFKLKNGNSDPIGQGTGFLISESVILTSSHCFVSWPNQNSDVTEIIPISFTIFQAGKVGVIQISSKIKRFKINKEFVKLFNEIVVLKKRYLKQEQQNLVGDILKLESQSIQHDFALLELQQKFQRPQYFQLSPNLSEQPTLLTVTGYQYCLNQYNFLTHSNNFNYITKAAIFYDIDTQGGQSGSPVYLSQDSSKLVGIHKAGNESIKLNFATMITVSMIRVLKMWVDEMGIPFESLKNLYKKLAPSLIKQANKLRIKGDKLRQQGQFETALSSYAQALGVTEQTQGTETFQCTKILHPLGFVCEKLGKIEQAFKYYQMALTIHKKNGTGSIRQAEILYNIGRIYQKQGKLDQAVQSYQMALTIHDRIGQNSNEFADNLYNIGGVYFKQSNLDKALQYYEKALQVYQKMNKKSMGWADTLFNIGKVYKSVKLDQKAKPFLLQAKEMENSLYKQ